MIWKDATSYSQSEHRGTEPRCWNWGKLKVHRYHGCDGWFWSHRDLNVSIRALRATDIEDAKAKATVAAHAELDHIRASLPPLPKVPR